MKVKLKIALIFSLASVGVALPDSGSTPSETWLAVGDYRGGPSLRMSNGGKVKLFSDLGAGNWIPAWQAFAVWRGGRFAALRVDGTISFIGKATLSEPSLSWAVSDDGRLVGEYVEASEGQEGREGDLLRIREISTGRVVRSFNSGTLKRSLHAGKRAPAALEGAAWSPSGTRFAFAHGFGGEVDNGGVAETQAGVLDLGTGRIRTWGKGAPIAWISADRLLVNGQGRTWILGPNGRVSATIDKVASAAWNGAEVLLFRQAGSKMCLERWDAALRRRLSSRPLAGLQWADLNDGVFAARRGRADR